eukprot:4775969-Amphidinium_carterae.1
MPREDPGHRTCPFIIDDPDLSRIPMELSSPSQMWQLRLLKPGQDGERCAWLSIRAASILGQSEFLKLIEGCFAAGANLEDVEAVMKRANIVVLGSNNQCLHQDGQWSITLQGSSHIHLEGRISCQMHARMPLGGTRMDVDEGGYLDWSIDLISMCWKSLCRGGFSGQKGTVSRKGVSF